MTELDVLSAYIRFLMSLAGGLAAFCFFATAVIDHFFTEFDLRDYRLAKGMGRHERAVGDLQVEDISIADLASQLTRGRMSALRERDLYRKISRRSFRSYLQV